MFKAQSFTLQILGGPATFDGQNWYTIRYLEHAVARYRQGTYLAAESRFGGLTYHGLHHVPDEPPSEVLYADCPECGEPEMIFYEGDYICAWCREMLEQ